MNEDFDPATGAGSADDVPAPPDQSPRCGCGAHQLNFNVQHGFTIPAPADAGAAAWLDLAPLPMVVVTIEAEASPAYRDFLDATAPKVRADDSLLQRHTRLNV